MARTINAAAASTVPNVMPIRLATSTAFDAEVWLADWADAGGLAALVGARLFLGRVRPIDRASHRRLDDLRRAAITPERASAVCQALAARAMVEADHG